MDDLPNIIYSNGTFLIFNKESALKLRRHRIVGQLIGCCPRNPHQIATSDLPCHLSRYAVRIILENKLALFNMLIQKREISVSDNESLHSKQLLMLKERTRQDHLKQRTAELKKRNIQPTSSRIGNLDDNKMRITVQSEPVSDLSTFDVISMSESEVSSTLIVDDDKMTVYRDLYNRGFYLSSGTKFGSDFLLYPGEPVRYHAKYAVRIAPGREESIDFDNLDFNEMNALNRLCSNSGKIPLFAVVYQTLEKSDKRVKYWSVRQKEYIEPKSASLYSI